MREPICGWIQFKKVGNGQSIDYAMKCEESNDTESTKEKESDHKRLKKMSRGQGTFSLFITKHYAECLKGVELKGEDGEYPVMDVIESLKKSFCLLYFMGDIDFGHTFETQKKHLKALKNLQSKFGDFVHVVVVRVCCVTSNIQSEAAKERLKLDGKEMEGVVYGRSRMDILKLYDLIHYDTGFFKYGLMLLDNDCNILVHPAESMHSTKDDNLGIFEKVASLIISAKTQ